MCSSANNTLLDGLFRHEYSRGLNGAANDISKLPVRLQFYRELIIGALYE